MKALVLGGSVFVGKHTVEALLAGGHDVAVLNRGRTPTDLPDEVERSVADRTDLDQLRAVLDGRDWDAVFDVSGFVMAAGGSDIEGLLGPARRATSATTCTSARSWPTTSRWAGCSRGPRTCPRTRRGRRATAGSRPSPRRRCSSAHRRDGFPATVVRPAAIYGPDNNIFDMELPMFLRLLGHRPILVPHGGLVVGSYGHVDDLCEAMVGDGRRTRRRWARCSTSAASRAPSTDTSRCSPRWSVRTPDVVYLPDSMLESLPGTVFGHLFGVRHHAMASIEKAQRLLGFTCRYDLRSGHEHTFEWFRAQGYADVVGSDGRPDVEGVVGLRRRGGGGRAGAWCLSRPTPRCGARSR